jgi:signal transduction histidine kinase
MTRSTFLILAALMFLAARYATASTPPDSPRTVLVVHWGASDFAGTPIVNAAIREALVSGVAVPIDYCAEYLETDRFPEEDATLAFRDYLRRKYRGRRIDVVVANADVALRFVSRYHDELFPGAPIVFVATALSPLDVRDGTAGLTGIQIRESDSETLDLALKLHPWTDHVFVVAQARDEAYLSTVQAGLAVFSKRVQLTYFRGQSLDHLIESVKALSPRSLVLYIRFSQETPGHVLYPADVARLVAQEASVPVYGSLDTFVGSGIVGGVVRVQKEVGTRLGMMAREILEGRRVEDMPIVPAPILPTFDWRQLQRWGIAEASLPLDSVLLFRELSVWERYRATIVVTTSVMLLQSFLIAGLAFEHRRRRRAEMESRRHLSAIAHLDRRGAMGELATSLAHELNQPLNAILQNAGAAQMMLASEALPPALGEIADIISDIRKDDVRASETIRRMRALLQKRELEMQSVDLNEVAQETIAIVRPDARSRGIELEADLSDALHLILGDRVHIQQVLLNLVMNAMDAVGAMPAGGRRVKVLTIMNAGEVRLAVVDSGTGISADRLTKIFEPFYTTKKEGSSMGMGLAIARSIVEAHSGRMGAENNPVSGATVWFSVPGRRN